MTLSLMILPKERFPLKRVRLSELFVKHMASRGNTLHWLLQNEENVEASDTGNNRFHISGRALTGNVLLNFLNRFRRLKKLGMGKKVLNSERIDIIIANDGIIEGFIGLNLARKHNIPFAFYLSSLFFDMDRNNLKVDRSPKTVIKAVESYPKEALIGYLVRRCDVFHPISEAMERYMVDVRRGGRTYPLPLCPADVFVENGRTRSLEEGERVELVYIGQISRLRRLDVPIEVLDILNRETGPEFHLTLVGEVFDKGYTDELLEEAGRRGVGKYLTIKEPVRLERVPAELSGSHVGLCLLPPIDAYKVSSPTKVLEYLALGIPVVANREIEDQRRVIELSGGGETPSFESREIAKSIMKMVRDRGILSEMSRKGREWVLSNRVYGSLSERLERYYLDIIEGK